MNHFHSIEKLLTGGGWTLVRTSGNLRQYKKVGTPASLIVPAPQSGPLSDALLEYLEAKTGLSLQG